MDRSQYPGRTELLEWVNKLLELRVEKVDQLSNGAIFLQLIDTVHNEKVPFAKIKWNSTLEYEHLYNYKLLQHVLKECKVNKHVPAERLVRGKYQDILEFLQWTKSYVEENMDPNVKYNARYKRVHGITKLLVYNNRQVNIANIRSLLPKWAWSDEINNEYIAKVVAAVHLEAARARKGGFLPSHTPSPAHTAFNKSPKLARNTHHDDPTDTNEAERLQKLDSITTFVESSTEFDHTLTNRDDRGLGLLRTPLSPANSLQHINQHIRLQAEEIASLQKQLKESRMETQLANLSKDFYYNKLRQIEILCQKNQGKPVDTKQLFNIMYASN